MRFAFILLIPLLLAGCASATYSGGQKGLPAGGEVRVFLPQVANATDDEHAGRAITELMSSALFERGIPVVQSEQALVKARAENAAGTDGLFLEAARSLQANYLLIGTVHEYRYKTDLDGDPAVGVTVRLVDVKDGQTLWQGSSARVSVLFASLSTASQRTVRDLVARMPLPHTGPAPRAANSN
jgi:hypothetical protein